MATPCNLAWPVGSRDFEVDPVDGFQPAFCQYDILQKKRCRPTKSEEAPKFLSFFLFKKAFEWNHSGPEVHFMIFFFGALFISFFVKNFESRGVNSLVGRFAIQVLWGMKLFNIALEEGRSKNRWIFCPSKKKSKRFFSVGFDSSHLFFFGDFDAGFWFLGMMKKQFWQRYIMYVNNILYTLNRWVGGFTDFICINSTDRGPTRYQNPHSQLQTHRENWQNLDWRYTAGQPENLDKSKRCFQHGCYHGNCDYSCNGCLFLHFASNLQLPSSET